MKRLLAKVYAAMLVMFVTTVQAGFWDALTKANDNGGNPNRGTVIIKPSVIQPAKPVLHVETGKRRFPDAALHSRSVRSAAPLVVSPTKADRFSGTIRPVEENKSTVSESVGHIVDRNPTRLRSHDAEMSTACRMALEYLTSAHFFSQMDKLLAADSDGSRFNGSRANAYESILAGGKFEGTLQRLALGLTSHEAARLPDYLQQVLVPVNVQSIERWKVVLHERIEEELDALARRKVEHETRARAEREAREMAERQKKEHGRRKEIEAETKKHKAAFDDCEFLKIDTEETISNLSDKELDERMKALNGILEKSHFDNVVSEEYKRLMAPYAAENNRRQGERNKWHERMLNIILSCIVFCFVSYLIALYKAYAGTMVVFRGWCDFLLSVAFFPLLIIVAAIFTSNDSQPLGFLMICFGGVFVVAAIASVVWAVIGGFWCGNRGFNAILAIGARVFTVGLSLFALAKVFDAGKKCYNADKHTRKEITQAMFVFAIVGFVYRFGIKPMIDGRNNSTRAPSLLDTSASQ